MDFIVDDMRVAIEAKASRNVQSHDLKGLRALGEDHPRVDARVVVSLEPKVRRTDDGILVLPVAEFTKRLWSGALV